MKTDGRPEGHQHESKFHQPHRLPHNPAEDIQHPHLEGPRDKVTRRSGEVVYPKHEAGRFESVESATDALKARKQSVMESVANPQGVMPKLAAASEHYRISRAVTDGNVASVEAVTGDDRLKAGKYQSQLKEFKDKRRQGWVNFIGEKLKDLGTGTADVAGATIPVLKKTGEAALDLVKYGFKTIGDMFVIGVDVIKRVTSDKKPESNEK